MATIVPRLWRLLHRRRCPIFQQMSVPEIVQVVLDGDVAHRWALSRPKPYEKRNCRVQYRESDLNFVPRLLDEGNGESSHLCGDRRDDGRRLSVAFDWRNDWTGNGSRLAGQTFGP